MSEVRKRKGESFESLLRRFSRRVQQSGRLLQAKKIRFHQSPKTRREVRDSALHRIKTRQKREYLIKTGLLKEEILPLRGRRR
ncbi:30S ribosomal protein S21 [Candidatus Uhrbacteria bacterium]|nr:30S ribosomal protein S21 [Candidatus Uhrbacteria bacterium]